MVWIFNLYFYSVFMAKQYITGLLLLYYYSIIIIKLIIQSPKEKD